MHISSGEMEKIKVESNLKDVIKFLKLKEEKLFHLTHEIQSQVKIINLGKLAENIATIFEMYSDIELIQTPEKINFS